MTSRVEFMQHAIRPANKGKYTADPNPVVGCVIVKHDIIIGEGWHRIAGQAHAEVNALNHAGLAASGADVFVTLEPCCHTGKTPPCTDALILAGVKRVFVAMTDPNPLVAGNGVKKLQDAGIEVEIGLLETQARDLNVGFIKRMKYGRPFVRMKLAMSLDGRTAMASGESKWISSKASRDDVQRMRAQSSAILTGIETVLSDDPLMNVRVSATELNIGADTDWVRQPKRIVLDSQLRIPRLAKIISQDELCIVYTTVHVDNSNAYPFIIESGCTQGSKQNARIDLSLLMQDLAEKEINLLHVEAGSVLCGALLKNDLVDEIVIYMAPHIMGDNAKGLFHLPELEMMKDRISLTINDVRMIGNDIRISAKPARIN